MPTRQREHFKQHVSTNMANRLATRNETEETRKRENQAGPRRGEKPRPEGEGQERKGRRRREEGKAGARRKGQNPRKSREERRTKKDKTTGTHNHSLEKKLAVVLEWLHAVCM